MSVYDCINGLARPWENVCGCMRLYIQPYMNHTWSPLHIRSPYNQYSFSTYMVHGSMVRHGLVRVHTDSKLISLLMISYSLILSPVALFFYNYKYDIGVPWLKVRKFMKASQAIKISQFISNIHKCVNLSVTWIQIGGTVCKPCECRVNRVKIVFSHFRR